MALLTQEGAEPIPGYRLLERLGTGGYGEVWKVTAPGGLTKAIKIVYGHMQDRRAEQELKALSRIRDVRHPFLLSLERFEIVDGQLMIVTELADMSLMDRFDACRKAGQRGIPREELLSCIRDTGDALDYMSEQFGLQHLDIKPQNLLLVGGRVKVADFGLVKNLQGSSATATGGVTPIYASPEAFDGRVSRHSDQYSLAIVYQEMLTGVRPFPGTTPLQLAMQHTHSPPVLDPLPAPDRPTIARALAKLPDQRYGSCRELADSLLRPVRPVRPGPVAPVPPPAPAAAPPARMQAEVAGDLLAQATAVGNGSLLLPAVAPEEPAAAWDITATAVPGPEESTPLASMAAIDDSGLRPTLFVGVGGLACATLRRLRRRLIDRFGSLAAIPILRFLLVDTDRNTFQQTTAMESPETLDRAEVLCTPLRKPEYYRPQSRELLRWLDRRWLYGIPRSLQTEGMRPLGRLALIDHANELLTRLRILVDEIVQPESLSAAMSATGMGVRDETPRVVLLASIAGGTGSGMLVDMAYAVRQVLRELKQPDDALCGILLYATSPKPTGKELARVNACAALAELQHFSRPGSAYPGDLRYGLKACRAGEPPFPEAYLVYLGDQMEEAAVDAATDNVAEFLHLQTLTTASSFFDGRQPSEAALAQGDRGGLRVRTFGMSRITVPRYLLADEAGKSFCKYLVGRWRGELSTTEHEQKELEAFRVSAARGLDVEAVAGLLLNAAATIWREEPRAYLQKFLTDALWGQEPRRGDPRLRQLGEQVLSGFDKLLGPGRKHNEEPSPASTPFEVALHDQIIEFGTTLGRSVVEWLIGLIEDPQKRQIKAADLAARWLAEHLAASADKLRTDLARLLAQRDALRKRLAAAEFPVAESSGGWFNLRSKAPPFDPQPYFLEYGLLRLRELVLETTREILGFVHGQLTAFTQDIARSLEKLRHFAEGFLIEPSASPVVPLGETPLSLTPIPGAAPIPNVQELLPDNAKTIQRATEGLFKQVGPQVLSEFENTLQTEVLNPLGGLWSIVSGSRELDVVLRDSLRKRARAAMLQALEETNAAQLYLRMREGSTALSADLRFVVDAASPRLTVPAESLHVLALLPRGAAGSQIRDLLAQEVRADRVTFLESEGDVIFCQESAPLSLAALMTELVGNRAAYVDAAQKVLTRVDVAWTGLKSSESLVQAQATSIP